MKGMALTIVETNAETVAITGGVDTHLDVHAAAALDRIGGVLGVESVPTTVAAYRALSDWLAGFGTVVVVGVEGTGSYGAGPARFLHTRGVAVVEVDRSDRQDRRRQGKSDPLDAISAARAAQSGRARGRPKGRDGEVEAIRTLMVAKRSARGDRTATLNQMRALMSTAPDDVRARFAHHSVISLFSETAAMRPRPGEPVGFAIRVALRELGQRAGYLEDQIDRLDQLLTPLVFGHAPDLLALHGVSPGRSAVRPPCEHGGLSGVTPQVIHLHGVTSHLLWITGEKGDRCRAGKRLTSRLRQPAGGSGRRHSCR